MKTILLIRPPEIKLPHRDRPMAYLPLGLLQIASVLLEEGYIVKLIDGLMPERKIGESGENFFGITLDEMRGRISGVDFDIVGISAQFTFQWKNALAMSRLCKEINPQSAVIIGGAHASVAFEDILQKHPSIDIAVRGEGERVMPALVKKIRGGEALDGINGIAYRKDGVIMNSQNTFIDDLDSLPFPAYHLMDMEKYFSLVKEYFTRTSYEFPNWERGITMITSRGCPFGCVFCSIHLHMGRRWRMHSPEYVLRHIKHLADKYGTRYIHFEDDNFTFDASRFEAILDGIIGSDIPIRWDTPNGVRADTFSEILLQKCRDSGCTHLIFGIESGVQRVLDKVINKGLKLSNIDDVLYNARRAGVDTRAFFMMGLPGETKEDIKASVAYALRIMWKYECFGGFSMAVPLAGTRLYELCEDRGYFDREPSIENLSASFTKQGIISTEEFDPDYLGRMRRYFDKRGSMLLFMLFWRKIFLHPKLISYVIRHIFPASRKNWSKVYYKIVFFHNALLFDMRKRYRNV